MRNWTIACGLVILTVGSLFSLTPSSGGYRVSQHEISISQDFSLLYVKTTTGSIVDTYNLAADDVRIIMRGNHPDSFEVSESEVSEIISLLTESEFIIDIKGASFTSNTKTNSLDFIGTDGDRGYLVKKSLGQSDELTIKALKEYDNNDSLDWIVVSKRGFD